jgi:hypothetical protein
MELPKPKNINFVGMSRKDQNSYYSRHVRELISWMLEQKDLPDKFRRPLETVNDYTYYLGYEVGATHLFEEKNG